jgi:putative ABC transport system permease protein
VIAVGSGWTVPLNNAFRNDGTFLIEGRPVPEGGAAPRAEYRSASPGYFDVIGVPILRGRAFDAHDRGETALAAVVSQGLARRHWGAADPLGQRVSFDQGKTWLSVVGVAGDVRQAALREEPADTIYVPFAQFAGYTSTLLVRTHGEPRLLERQLREKIRALDAQAAVSSVQTLEEIRSDSLSSPRLTTVLLGAFAFLALAISAAGLYGVLAYSVSQRTREIGIRMALGAERGRVMRMLLGQGLTSVGLGLGLGLLGALGLTQLVSGLLFGVEPTDPLCFVGSAMVLVGVGILACLVPARRATTIQPTLALRAE